MYAPRIGWEEGNGYDYCDMTDLAAVEKGLKSNTTMVWIECQTNPTLKVPNIEAIAKLCKAHEAKIGKKVTLVIDNTFNSPLLCNPLELGVTICLHSATKYLGGHANVIAGCVMLNNYELFVKLKDYMETQGSTISPLGADKVLTGIKTMQLRVKK